MQLTAILSDLNSLRACVGLLQVAQGLFQYIHTDNRCGQDHAAALALVSSRPVPLLRTITTGNTLDVSSTEKDEDLRRPYELCTLHKNIKLAYGTDANSAPTQTILELRRARSEVDRAVSNLGLKRDGSHADDNVQPSTELQPEQGQDMDYDEDDAWT